MPIWLDDDTPLDRLLSGGILDDPSIKKIQREESLFKPTPFIPTKLEYLAMFTREVCAKCKDEIISFDGYFSCKSDAKGTRDLIALRNRDVTQEMIDAMKMEVDDRSTPTCFTCFSSKTFGGSNGN